MRRADELPPDPEVSGGLEAIEAVLEGRPADPARADLAQLATLLVADRPQIDAGFAATLDERVAQSRTRSAAAPRRQSRWVWSPAAGLAACLLVAVVIVATEGKRTPARTPTTAAQPASPATAASASGTASAGAAAEPKAASGGNLAAPVVQPPSNGRKITQSAQLALTVAPDRIETVAQEVYDVVGQARGVVNNSTVTAGGPTGSYAQFQLSVPSVALPETMAALSGLRYAQVASRTDTTQDVTDQYQHALRQLADARALRTSLLRQLARATTQSEIDSLTARIHDAEASISSDQAALARLNHQVDLTQIAVTINAGSVTAPATDGGGFNLSKALHTAGRVLTVAAGVLVIVAAGLLPLALLAGLAWWAAAMIRRQRREQALDRA